MKNFREEVIDQIVEKVKRNWSNEAELRRAFKYLDDAHLIYVAQTIGVDTDAISNEQAAQS